MAGPFQEKTGFNVDEIIQEGLAGPGVGASTNVPTASTPPIPGAGDPVAGTNTQTGRGFGGFDVEQPTWAWRPTQQDFGQVDVRRGQYDTGMVPTVQTQMPFSAFANRQQALEQKKAALAQKMAAYDPYAGIGKAHDRYQTAFNRYAVNYINQKRQGIADSMFGGDMALADKYLGTDPQGRAMLAQWGSEMQALGSENKAWTDSFIDLTSRVASGETYVPPEYMNEIMQFGSALGNDGLPVQGMEVSEFLPMGRNAEGRLREIQYVDEIVTPGLKNALKTTTGIDIGNRRKGGKIVMTEREEKTFDDALKYFVSSDDGQDFVELYHGGDKDKAFTALKSFFPTSVKEDVTLTSPYNPNEGNSGAGDDALKASAYNVSYSQVPEQVWEVETEVPVVGRDGKPVIDISTGKQRTKKEYRQKEGISDAVFNEVPTLNLFDIVSKQGRTPVARQFKTYGEGGGVGGASVFMHPTDIVRMGNKLFIVGKETGMTKTRQLADKDRLGGDTEPTTEEFSQLRSRIVPYKGNERIIEEAFPWLTDAGIRQALGAAKQPERKSAESFDTDAPQNGEKRSDGAVYNASLGGWYKKVGGEYVNVQ